MLGSLGLGLGNKPDVDEEVAEGIALCQKHTVFGAYYIFGW